MVLGSPSGLNLTAKAAFKTKPCSEEHTQGRSIPCDDTSGQFSRMKAAESKVAKTTQNFPRKSAPPEFGVSDHQADIGNSGTWASWIKKLDFCRSKENLGHPI